jgi:spermidine synthase
MAIPWKTIERVDTDEGVLELRRHGQGDFLIAVDGRVLMNSASHRTEAALGDMACRHLQGKKGPQVLVGGLGMGFTLRAVLESVPADGAVVVAELNPVVVSWCRGPLLELTGGAAADSRVRIEIGDVARLVRSWAEKPVPEAFDAVIYDLYTGPYTRTHKKGDPLYGNQAIEFVRAVLCPGGIFAVWGEDYDAGFVKRMEAGGLATTVRRPKKGGPRHVIYLGTKPGK